MYCENAEADSSFFYLDRTPLIYEINMHADIGCCYDRMVSHKLKYQQFPQTTDFSILNLSFSLATKDTFQCTESTIQYKTCMHWLKQFIAVTHSCLNVKYVRFACIECATSSRLE